MKKGQISFFIIVCVVIILIAFAGLWISKTIAKNRDDQAITSQKISQTEIKPIADYAKNCLDLISKEGLLLLGKQGGYIYEHQGGQTPLELESTLGQTHIKYQDYDIIYSLLRPTGSILNQWFFFPPNYPWKTFPEIKINGIIEETNKGIFGVNRFYKTDIREAIQGYLQKNLDSCFDQSKFSAQGFQLEQRGDITVNLEKSMQTIILKIDYPIVIKDTRSNSERAISEVVIEHPFRIGQMQEIAMDLIDKESSTINYNPKDIETENVMITVEKDVFGTDDIIILKDKTSEFTLNLPIQNRNPVLYYLNGTETNGQYNNLKLCIYKDANGREYRPTIAIAVDVLKISNPSQCGLDYTIPLNAKDPDDDAVYYILKQDGKEITQFSDITIDNKYLDLELHVSDGTLNDYQTLEFEVNNIE